MFLFWELPNPLDTAQNSALVTIGAAPISVRIISWDTNTSLIMQEIIETKDLFKFLQTKVKEIQAH